MRRMIAVVSATFVATVPRLRGARTPYGPRRPAKHFGVVSLRMQASGYHMGKVQEHRVGRRLARFLSESRHVPFPSLLRSCPLFFHRAQDRLLTTTPGLRQAIFLNIEQMYVHNSLRRIGGQTFVPQFM
jgi:hypothetical protein